MRTLSFTVLPYTLMLLVCFFALCGAPAHAAEQYQPLVGIPGLTNDSTRTLENFFNTAYMVLIGLGALFAVFKISMAGIKYSLSDLISSKSEAKSDIYGALLGLAILLIPAIVLETINPNLTNINVLGGAVPVILSQTETGTAVQGPSAATLNQRTADACTAAPGKQLGPSCPQGGITPTAKSAAASCTGGFYDFKLNQCFSANSTYEYDTSGGQASNYNGLTGPGWEAMCKAAGKKADFVEVPPNKLRYSCK